jgi:hypothetical protein
MKRLIYLFICLICFEIQNAWSLQPKFSISAGKKSIEFNTPGITWSHFCSDSKMGCARFTLNENNKKNFGFVKPLTDQIALENFNIYCMNAFLESKKVEKDIEKYTVKANDSISSCSWSTGQDLTLIVWKEGLTVMLTSSDKSSVQALISLMKEARLYELP